MIYKSIYLANRNPSIAPEDWPRTWRSHPKEVAKMAAVGAGIRSTIDTINYCARVRDPMLDGKPYTPPGASTEYDGVAVVSSAREDLHNTVRNREGQEAVIADEVRVFGRAAELFTVAGSEMLAVGGPMGQSAVIRLLMRKPDTTTEAFLERLKGAHADLAKKAVDAGEIGRYVQNVVELEQPPGYEFDAVTEAWHPTVEDSTRSFTRPSLQALADDLRNFCDMDRSVTMLTEVIYRLPRE